MITRTSIIAALAVALAGCGGTGAAPATNDTAEFYDLDGNNTWAMVLPAGTPAADWTRAAKGKCGAVEFCRVSGWTDSAQAARTFPFTEAEVASQAFQYGLNRSSAYEQSLWNCDIVSDAAPDACM